MVDSSPMEKVGFIGLGKLGLPCALAISERTGDSVIGYDVNPHVGEYISSKSVPYVEEELSDYFDKGSVEFTTSISEVVAASNVIFFSVQTPHDPLYEGNTPAPSSTSDFSYEFLIEAFKSTCDEINRQAKSNVLLVVISTVLPGTMRRELLPILESAAVKIEFCYNPFFIAMGTTINDFLNPEFVLIGSDSPEAAQRLENFYSFINAPKVLMQIESAELTKVAYNTFIGFKIVFANTIGEICGKIGGSPDEVTGALTMAKVRLMSGKYLSAGMADGGGCHPRDQIAMSHLAKQLSLSVNIFQWLANARDLQTKRQADFIATIQRETNLPVVLLGRSYKKNINLVIGSPADLLGYFLSAQNISFTFYDPYVMPGQAEPTEPAIFFVSCNHDCFKELPLPAGSICIDPWGNAISVESVEVRYIPIGRPVTAKGN